jgi:coenzyme Q-binding protein COQ10
MPEFKTQRRVRHSASDMFALVADVERYPEFVPLCESLRVVQRKVAGEGVEILTAEMTVAYKLLRESFISQVKLDRPKCAIQVEYLQGPFSRLNNRWTFQPIDGGQSDIIFYISYEFRSRMLGLIMGAAFDTAFRRFAEAFEKRADVLHTSKMHLSPMK